MNSVVEDTLDKLRQCDDFHNRCDCLLEHSEITYLLEYIQQKENIIKEVREYITYWHYRNDFRINSFTTGVKEELLEILDKEKENG